MGGEGKRGVCQGSVFVCECFPKELQWKPVNTVTNGPKTFGRVNGVAVLTKGFLTRKCMAVFVRLPKKVAVLPRWP